MGFLAEVTNGATGKRYRISTVEVARTGVWQTAVFRKGLGPFGLFRPVLFVGGAEGNRARIQHERVEAIIRDVSPKDWDAAKWSLLSEFMKDEIGVVDARDPSDRARQNDRTDDAVKLSSAVGVPDNHDQSGLLWTAFLGKSNTANLLREKAKVVVALIISALEDGVIIASEMQGPVPGIRMADSQVVTVKVETAAFWLRVVDEIGFTHLIPADRETFMDALETGVTQELGIFGVDASEFQSILKDRYSEYGQYLKWMPDKGESARGTLLWEFAKRIAAILGIGKNALFNHSLSSLLIKQLHRWDLPALMKG